MLLSVKRQLTSDKKSLNRLQPIAHFKSEVSCDVDLDDKPLDVIYLKNLLSEVSCVLTDNNISMNLEKWVGRGKKLPAIRDNSTKGTLVQESKKTTEKVGCKREGRKED